MTLAIRLQRAAFDSILAQAVHSVFIQEVYGSEAAWKGAVEHSSVRLQWDPDHDPSGTPVERRAIQLGLRGDVLARFAKDWIIDIEDISDFVRQQREHTRPAMYAQLITPREMVYPVTDSTIAAKLGIVAT